MLTALVVAAVLVVLLIAAVAATHEGDVLVDAPADAADVGLPELMVQPEDIAEVRFGMTLRGYRMSEVDHVLERLAQELAGRDAQIAALQQAMREPPEPEEPEEAAGRTTPTMPRTPWRTPAPHNPAPEVVAWSASPAAAEPEPEAPVSTSWWEPEPATAQEQAPAEATTPAAPQPVSTWDDDFPEVLTPEDAPEGLADAAEPPARLAGAPAPPAEPRTWSAPAFPSGPPEEATPSGEGSTSP